jgi:hypothetical protein
MKAGNPISTAAESRFRQAARQLGAAHGSAGLTPYVADDRPEDDYSRTLSGYTGYLAHEDGVLLLMTALGVPVPEADEGPWSGAYWRIAREYTDAYDSAVRAWPPVPGFVTANGLATWLRDIGTSDTRVVTTGRGTIAVTGTLPSNGWGFAVDAGPATEAGQLLPDSLTLHRYESSDPARPVDPDTAGDIVDRGISAAEVIVLLASDL